MCTCSSQGCRCHHKPQFHCKVSPNLPRCIVFVHISPRAVSNERAPHSVEHPNPLPHLHTSLRWEASKGDSQTSGSIDEGRRRGGHPLCQRLSSGRVLLMLPEPATSHMGSWDGPLAGGFRGLTCSRNLQIPFSGSPFITKCFVQSQHWGQ